jgi:hypothetical protein
MSTKQEHTSSLGICQGNRNTLPAWAYVKETGTHFQPGHMSRKQELPQELNTYGDIIHSFLMPT